MFAVTDQDFQSVHKAWCYTRDSALMGKHKYGASRSGERCHLLKVVITMLNSCILAWAHQSAVALLATL